MGPKYEVDGDDLCVRIPVDAIVEQAVLRAYGPCRVLDKNALALAMGRELCEQEDAAEDLYINKVLDAAIVRVIEGAEPCIEFLDD